MNERIKAIWNKAASSHEQMETSWQTQQNFLNRFAELIVGECAMVLSKVPGGHDSSVFYKNSKILKEHFGVEE